MTDFSPLDSALYESTPEKIAASLRYLRKADAVMAALMPLVASPSAPVCVCGEPTLGVVHRADGPCYLPERVAPAAVPAGYVLVKVQHEDRDGFWSFSDNEENFVGEECDTELDAIAAAFDYYGDDLEVVYVGKAKRIDKARLVRGDNIIELIGDAADEEVGECAYDWPHLSNDECAELERIVMGYVLSKSPADFYSVENMRVYTREQAEEMLAAANKENGNG